MTYVLKYANEGDDYYFHERGEWRCLVSKQRHATRFDSLSEARLIADMFIDSRVVKLVPRPRAPKASKTGTERVSLTYTDCASLAKSLVDEFRSDPSISVSAHAVAFTITVDMPVNHTNEERMEAIKAIDEWVDGMNLEFDLQRTGTSRR